MLGCIVKKSSAYEMINCKSFSFWIKIEECVLWTNMPLFSAKVNSGTTP